MSMGEAATERVKYSPSPALDTRGLGLEEGGRGV